MIKTLIICECCGKRCELRNDELFAYCIECVDNCCHIFPNDCPNKYAVRTMGMLSTES